MTLETTLDAVNQLKTFIEKLNNPKIRFGVLVNRYGTEFLLCGISYGSFFEESTKELSEKFPATGYIPNSDLKESGNYGHENIFLTQRIPGAVRVSKGNLIEIISRMDIRDWVFPKISIWHFDSSANEVYQKMKLCASLEGRAMKRYHPGSWSRTGVNAGGYTYFFEDLEDYACHHPFISHKYKWGE